MYIITNIWTCILSPNHGYIYHYHNMNKQDYCEKCSAWLSSKIVNFCCTKNGVEFRQRLIGALRWSLAISYDDGRRRATKSLCGGGGWRWWCVNLF